MKSSRLRVETLALQRPVVARVIVRLMVLTTLFCVFALLPHTAMAAPLVSVGSVVVDEGDSRLIRTVEVPISWSGAVHLRVRIEIVLRRQRDEPFNRLRSILPFSTTQTLEGNGTTTIPIRVRGDLDREPDELADVKLTFVGPVRGGDASIFTLRDDDHPTVTVGESNALEGSVGLGQDGPHPIVLSKAINQPTRLRVQTINDTAIAGVDYVAVDRIITIRGRETGTILVVPIINNDRIGFDLVKRYFVQVTPVRESDLSEGGNRRGLGRITDDEFSGPIPIHELIFQLSDSPVPPPARPDRGCQRFLVIDEPFNGDANVSFKLSVFPVSGLAFEVLIFTDNPSQGPRATSGQDYDPIENVFVFPANTRSMDFTLRVHDDGENEPDEGFQLVVRSPRMLRPFDTCGRGVGRQEVKIRGNIL